MVEVDDTQGTKPTAKEMVHWYLTQFLKEAEIEAAMKVSPKNFNPWWVQKMMEQIPKSMYFQDAMVIARAVWKEMYDWVASYKKAGNYGFIRFKMDWQIYRLCISLQQRLVVEQILWNEGKPWSTLCTGFKSIGQGSG